MKRIAGAVLICLLILALAGCSRVSTTTDVADAGTDFTPDQPSYAVLPEPTQPEVLDLPIDLTDEPVQDEPAQGEAAPEDGTAQEDGTAAESKADPGNDTFAEPSPTPGIDVSSYRFQRLTDTSFGLTFEYPTHWINVPGKYTVCFREEVEDGDYPARVAITRKTLAHSPSSERVLAQFQSFAQIIYGQYDPSTFELGELNASARFLGQNAYEITYLAYSGDVEIKGYMVCCAVEKSIYLFHFSASYSDYAAMESMIGRMRDSVALTQ